MAPPHLLLECLTLRVKDLDLERGEIRIRRGKGGVDRVTVLPEAVRPGLAAHLARARALHRDDLAGGGGRVVLPGALGRKLPNAAAEWAWQWVFPAARTYRDRVTGERRRHHLHPSAMQRAMVLAVRRSRVGKRATCHTNAGDLQAFGAILSADAVVMPPNEPAHQGADLEQWLRTFFEQFSIRVTATDDELHVTGEWAIHRYSFEWTVTPKAGGSGTTERGVGIHVLRKQADGTWKLARDIWHPTSPPPAPAPATRG